MYIGKRIKVAIVDNDPLTLALLVSAIKHFSSSMDVVWSETSGKQTVKICLNHRSRPDVLLVDMSLEDMQGPDVCRLIRSRDDKVVLIGITSFSFERYYATAMENGAQCLLDKVHVSKICEVVCELANDSKPDTPHYSDETKKEAYLRLSMAAERRSPATFSRREEEIMSLCTLGKSSKEIAEQLGVKESTVKTYIRRVAGKIGTSNRTETIIKWMMRGRV